MDLGIDLGTSNSAIVGHLGAELRLFKTTDGADVLPSLVFIDHRGRRFVGQRALEQGRHAPGDLAQGFKRLMGTSTALTFASSRLTLSPEEASAEILRTLLGQATAEVGPESVSGTVVTVPAAFNQMQSEATIRAARMAGIDRAGLLQEPIAAALASLARTKARDGVFLVYDLGGGTFDVAIVQSVAGAVGVVAHEGVNMLGGRDIDRLLVERVIRPWLLAQFDLDVDFEMDPAWSRLLSLSRVAAERAKIELSTSPTAVILAPDHEIRLADRAGRELYLDIDLARADFEELVRPEIERTGELCLRIVADNGYMPGDIDRIVFIGGPSKMPLVRNLVPEMLGIRADLALDPMTAVAYGAAIFAESREWTAGPSRRKSPRATTEAILATDAGALDIRFDHPARTSLDHARLLVRTGTGLRAGCRLQVDTALGWTSGPLDLEAEVTIDLPVPDQGPNRYRVTVFGPDGQPRPEAETMLTVTRTWASAAGIPATQDIAVKVVETGPEGERNALEPLLHKGAILPTAGNKSLRAARDLAAGEMDHIDLELYAQAPGVPEPELNLFIGSFRIEGADLRPGTIIRQGDEIKVDWRVDDNGLLACQLTVPAINRVFDTGRFYCDAAGHRSFSGEEGAALARAMLEDAAADLAETEAALAFTAHGALTQCRRHLENQREILGGAGEPEIRRQVSEEARQIRQTLSRLRHAPEHRGAVLERTRAGLEADYARELSDLADPRSATRFAQIDGAVGEAIRRATPDALDLAERGLKEMEHIIYRELWRQPGYLLWLFKTLREERYLAVDHVLHGRLAEEGDRAINVNDMNELRRVINRLATNRFSFGAGRRSRTGLAGLTRG